MPLEAFVKILVFSPLTNHWTKAHEKVRNLSYLVQLPFTSLITLIYVCFHCEKFTAVQKATCKKQVRLGDKSVTSSLPNTR